MDLVDSDVLIGLLRGHGEAVRWLAGLSSIPAVPGFVVLELLAGTRDKPDMAKTRALLAKFPFFWPSQGAMDASVLILAEFSLSHKISAMDALIAACALELDTTLWTNNSRDFRLVPGLKHQRVY